MSKHKITADQHRNLGLLIDALLSGKYQQATGLLRDSVGYCCLGVACDLSHLGTWKPNTRIGGDDRYDFVLPNGEKEHAALLRQVMAHYGFPSQQGFLWTETLPPLDDDDDPRIETNSLSNANDSGAPFSWIAERIRRWRDEECELTT